jgi:hypothetical protein
MIDATLATPFFRRNPDGSVMYPSEAGFASQFGALQALPGDEEGDSEADEDEDSEYVHESGAELSDSDSEYSDPEGALPHVGIQMSMSMGHKAPRKHLRGYDEEANAGLDAQEPGRRNMFETRAQRRRAEAALALAGQNPGQSGPRTRIDFKFFETSIWPRIQRKVPTKNASASSVFQEIQSFIKVLKCSLYVCMCVFTR